MEIRFDLILASDAEQPLTAARKEVIAASKAVPSKPVYGLAPLTCAFQSAANALPAGPPAALAAVPRSPTTGSPIALSTSAFRNASVINVLPASHLPVRTSDGANF